MILIIEIVYVSLYEIQNSIGKMNSHIWRDIYI